MSLKLVYDPALNLAKWFDPSASLPGFFDAAATSAGGAAYNVAGNVLSATVAKNIAAIGILRKATGPTAANRQAAVWQFRRATQSSAISVAQLYHAGGVPYFIAAPAYGISRSFAQGATAGSMVSVFFMGVSGGSNGYRASRGSATAATLARLGDQGSHNGSYIGSITSASPNVNANGVAIARNGDSYSCPLHGTQSLISTRAEKANGQSIVGVGDSAACGAVIFQSSPNVFAR